MTQLAYAVPSVEVPARVKVRLLDRIAEDEVLEPPGASTQKSGNILRPLFGLGGFAAAHGGLAVDAAFAVIMARGSVWFNDRLENVSQENQVLKSRLDTVEQEEVPSLASEVAQMAENESEMMDMIDKQRELAYMLATPNNSVSRLTSSTRTTATDSEAQANGVIIFV